MAYVVSKALASKWNTLEDSDAEEKEDIGERIGDHLIPVGTLLTDPEPKRVVFASLNIRGNMDIKVFSIPQIS